jgi:hypothetical protein
MKSFREYLNEGKLDKSSFMSGTNPLRDINFDERKGIIKVWVNGGTAYEIKTTPEIVKNMREKFFSDEGSEYMKKYVDNLAFGVAEFIEKEVNKWEKNFK